MMLEREGNGKRKTVKQNTLQVGLHNSKIKLPKFINHEGMPNTLVTY